MEAFALGCGVVQRLALFDLDNTLVDLNAAFAVWAAEFASAHGLGQRAVDWLVALNREGYPHREVFFAKVLSTSPWPSRSSSVPLFAVSTRSGNRSRLISTRCPKSSVMMIWRSASALRSTYGSGIRSRGCRRTGRGARGVAISRDGLFRVIV